MHGVCVERARPAVHAVQAGSLSGWQWAEGSPLDVAREPAHLARIAAQGPGHIAAAALSAAGQHVVFAEAGPDSTRLFRLACEVRCTHS